MDGSHGYDVLVAAYEYELVGGVGLALALSGGIEMIFGMNVFWLATAWAVICVLAASVLLGNSLPPWGLSGWWVPVLVLVGLAPIIGLIAWMMVVIVMIEWMETARVPASPERPHSRHSR